VGPGLASALAMLADGVALRNRCPQGQADPRAAIAGGASGVTMADRWLANEGKLVKL